MPVSAPGPVLALGLAVGSGAKRCKRARLRLEAFGLVRQRQGCVSPTPSCSTAAEGAVSVANSEERLAGGRVAGRVLAPLTALLAIALACRLGPTPSGPSTSFVWPTASPTISMQTRPPSPTATSSVPTPTPEPTDTPTPTRSPHLGIEHVGGELGEVWTLADVRVGTHADRVRVVFQMIEPGNHVPRFRAVEVDNQANPFPDGPGPDWGLARIDLFISDLYAYGYPLADGLPMEVVDSPLVTRVGSYPTYDDALLGFSIGLEEPASYQVLELTAPVRIVIDVLSAGQQ
jgi:hypothetical protein